MNILALRIGLMLQPSWHIVRSCRGHEFQVGYMGNIIFQNYFTEINKDLAMMCELWKVCCQPEKSYMH